MPKVASDIKAPANVKPDDEPLWWLLHWYAKDAKSLWPACRRTGMNDADLRDTIVDALPGRESHSLPCAMWWCYAPSDEYFRTAPAVWLNADSVGWEHPVDPSQPIVKIEGQTFLNKARAMLAIPYPGEATKEPELVLDDLEQRPLWE